MEKSENINELANALCQFQGENKPIIFDAKNPFFKSKYASLTGIVEGCKEGLQKHGLAVSQLVGSEYITTILMHNGGQWISTNTKLSENSNKGLSASQAFGVAVSYARRYAYASILGVVSDEDTDGNTNTQPVKKVVLATPEQRALIAKMLSSSIFDKERDGILKNLGSLSPEKAKDALDWLTKEVKARKEILI